MAAFIDAWLFVTMEKAIVEKGVIGLGFSYSRKKKLFKIIFSVKAELESHPIIKSRVKKLLQSLVYLEFCVVVMIWTRFIRLLVFQMCEGVISIVGVTHVGFFQMSRLPSVSTPCLTRFFLYFQTRRKMHFVGRTQIGHRCHRFHGQKWAYFGLLTR